MAFEVLHEEAMPMGLKVYWPKIKIQLFGDLLDDTLQSVHACGKGTKVTKIITYLGKVVHNDDGSCQEIF